MSERFRSCVDVHLILRRADEVLLGQRHNTGFADGCWHPPAGHVEDGESATSALVRETIEEIGVMIDPAQARLVHLMYHRSNEPRVALFFEVTRWSGEPVAREPGKCAGWDWFPLVTLPTEMIDYAVDALAHYAKGTMYSERGWGSR